jgi:hypothetical protein
MRAVASEQKSTGPTLFNSVAKQSRCDAAKPSFIFPLGMDIPANADSFRHPATTGRIKIETSTV